MGRCRPGVQPGPFRVKCSMAGPTTRRLRVEGALRRHTEPERPAVLPHVPVLVTPCVGVWKNKGNRLSNIYMYDDTCTDLDSTDYLCKL